MKHYGVAVAALVSMGVLTGCVSPIGSGDVASSSHTGGAPDSHNEGEGEVPAVSGAAGTSVNGEEDATLGDAPSSSVLPPLGPFDPTEPGFSLFDPCTEIPQEVFQELGFDKQVNAPKRDAGVAHCGFENVGNSLFVGIGAVDQSLNEVRKINQGSRQYEGQYLPVIGFEDRDFGGLFCSVFLETERGTIVVDSTGEDLNQPYQTKCADAEQALVGLASY